MTYVKADQLNTQGVDWKRFLCFEVTGKWSDLHPLAVQVKSKYVAPAYTVLLIDDRHNDKCKLIIAGDINLADDNAYRLVEQRIAEGLQVELSFGRYFRSTFIYSFQEEALPEPSDEELLAEFKDHPF